MKRIWPRFPANIKEGLEIIPVSHVDQVLARALVAPLVAVEWTEADELASITCRRLQRVGWTRCYPLRHEFGQLSTDIR